MNLKEKIDADIKSAMLSRDNVKKEILKFIKSEIQRNEAGLKTLDDADIQKMMRGQVENLKTITNSETTSREIEVLESYLPKMMSEEEIKEKVVEIISSGINNIGAIMGHFTKNYKGLADNKKVMEIAKSLL